MIVMIEVLALVVMAAVVMIRETLMIILVLGLKEKLEDDCKILLMKIKFLLLR
jgi:hypothetical protein